ncbi:hypothetical protein IFM53868_08442 [Aspergillus udagawae]|uniref:Uncharacterized protein n=1 Tax=Aspergillus udagawae TaxID=91492 RepID=A0ABQ1B8T3_9EURO|nr:hypothetical protein IFM53868_08442 [Aspergillus udagawae]
MANTLGYEVIPQAIPKDLAQKAANALLKQPKLAREKYDAFEIPPICLAIRDEFIKNTDKNALVRIFHPKPVPSQPDHIFAGIFRETEADPKKLKTAEKGEIYATIALTPLSSLNGWYTFYEGSRANQSVPDDSTPTAALSLEVGDVVVNASVTE